jgi:hypothetical protein
MCFKVDTTKILELDVFDIIEDEFRYFIKRDRSIFTGVLKKLCDLMIHIEGAMYNVLPP